MIAQQRRSRIVLSCKGDSAPRKLFGSCPEQRLRCHAHTSLHDTPDAYHHFDAREKRRTKVVLQTGGVSALVIVTDNGEVLPLQASPA
jgi:hypothetical protein